MATATATKKGTRSPARRATRAYKPKKKRVRATQQQRTALHDYDDTWLECRDLKHAWETIGVFRDANGHRVRVLHCTRECEVQGFDLLGVGGERVKPRRYKYPDGYKTIGKIEVTDLRVEAIRRTKIYRSEAAMAAEVFNGRKR